MSESPNKLIKFWQELKRRKTGKVIIAYAATAFILLQLADILTPALLLPEWTTRLVTLILIIGFPIAVIFSWVFDITPEGIKKTESIKVSENKETIKKPANKILSGSNIIIAVLIIVVAMLAYPKIFKRNTLDKLRSSGERISVAVMPFQNMTGDTTWNIRQVWIQDILINSLSNSVDLRIRQAENIYNLVKNHGIANNASISRIVASTIAQKLDASVFIYGNIKLAGNILQLSAQLIDSKTEDVFKSFQIEGNYKQEKIFQLIDSLSTEIKNFLIISKLKQGYSHETPAFITTNSPEAFRYFLNGRNSYSNEDYPAARNMFFQALAIDSNINIALTFISTSYMNEGLYDQAKKWCQKAYKKREQMPIIMNLITNWLFANNFETPYKEIVFLRDIIEIDDQMPTIHYLLGYAYSSLCQYDKAIPEYEKSLEISTTLDIRHSWIYSYTYLGRAYHNTGQYKKEKNTYKEAEKDFPNNPVLCYRQAVLALSEGDVRKGNEYIEKFISLSKGSPESVSEIASVTSENFSSEAAILTNIAKIYSEANILDNGEKYYRQALSLEPVNPLRLNNLAWFLINKDRNIKEGLELVRKALDLSPDNYDYLYTYGWGLYLQGKYKEALDILQKSWVIRREKAIYDHEAYLHLEAAKKAVAGLKAN
jgi:tetratricopeptide (TPR) repeat protein